MKCKITLSPEDRMRLMHAETITIDLPDSLADDDAVLAVLRAVVEAHVSGLVRSGAVTEALDALPAHVKARLEE